ncbi:MAG: DUF2970 domain-containing protein [Burkholderiales bacterium]
MDDEHKKASPWQALRMVLAAFFGVRRKAGHEQLRVTPLQVVVIAVIAAAMFVLGVIMVVRLVTR